MDRVVEGNCKRFVIEVLLVPENNNTDFHVEDDGQISEENYETNLQSETHLIDIEENKPNISEHFTKLDCAQLKFPKEEIFSDSRDTEPASDSVINNSLSSPSTSVEDGEISLKTEIINSDNYTITKLQNQKKNYICATCDLSFKSRARFKLHIKGHSKKIHQCTLCYYSSSSEYNLKKHIVLHNSNNKQYKCNNCHFITKYQQNLKRHINNIHLKSKEYFCNICKQSYFTEINYAKHMSLHSAGILKRQCTKSNLISNNKLHTKNTKKQYKCDLCKYSCTRSNSFAKHMRLHSEGISVHKCSVCHYITDTKSHFGVHLKIHSRHELANVNSTSENKELAKVEEPHSKAKLYKCKRCDYTSHFKNTFAKHMELHLNGCFVHKCTICSFITDKKQHFENHVNAHLSYEMPKLDDPLIPCSQNRDSIKLPKDYAKRNSYKCNICKYSVRFKTNLAKHMELHSNGDAKYKCDICHYITNKRHHYTRHMKRHSTPEQPKCSTSKNKESTKPNTNVKSYKCNICEYSCSSENNYAKHMSLHSAEIVKHKCTKTNYITEKLGNINKNMKTPCKNNQSKYRCNICKYTCSRECSLDKHIKLHSKHVVLHKCSICLYITDILDHYVRHMKRHSKLKRKVACSDLRHEKRHLMSSKKCIHCKQFKCNICKYTTFQKDKLSKHMKKHSKYTEYQCNICKHSCASSANLTLHKRLHPIWNKCKHCNYFASSLWKLNQHLSKHSAK